MRWPIRIGSVGYWNSRILRPRVSEEVSRLRITVSSDCYEMSWNSSTCGGGSDESTLGAMRKTGRRIVVIGLALVLVVAAVICLGVGISNNKGRDQAVPVRIWKVTSKVAVKHACSSTRYPETCISSVSNHPGLSSKSGTMDIANIVLDVTIRAVEKAFRRAERLSRLARGEMEHTAVHDCLELFDETLEELRESLSELKNSTLETISKHAHDLITLLSAALTNQYTCLDGLQYCNGNVHPYMEGRLLKVSHLVSNALAMVKNISDQGKRLILQKDLGHNRRLLSDQTGYGSVDDQEFVSEYGSIVDGFPSWVSAGDRRLLQTSRGNIKPDVVVAKDGSGNYRTITEAVHEAPERGETRYVIHVKAGVYKENVEVHKKKTNLMFVGDGVDSTVVTGSKNVVDGSTTFHSATVAVTGKGFMARDITFENTAGPSKHQAVALRVGADLSAFYRCSFKGYQDTLYAHSLRQFYRECNVYGTVDFIFGNAAAVLQNCNLLARKPNANQNNVFTAQGRQDPNQNTGFSIHNCTVIAAPDLAPVKSSFATYLGRPWKEYSRTVFLQSYLGDLIDPAGWLEWSGNFALSTLYYGEYQNRGPGAGTAKRVEWPGYHVITSQQEASQFTVAEFISGNSWLPSRGITFTAGLTR